MSLTAQQVADKLKVHRMTVCRWVVRGRLRPECGKGKGHGKQQFTEQELLRFLQEEGNDDCYWWRKGRG